MSEIDEWEMLEPVNKMRKNLIITISLATILIVAIGIFFAKMITNPILTISNSMTILSGGDTSIDIPETNRKDEIGILANSAVLFKKSLLRNKDLTEDLKKHRDTLEEEVQIRTKDLTEANNELEEFFYRTSHDLLSPVLSSIKLLSIAEMSIEKENYALVTKSVTHSREALEKLEALINDLQTIATTKNKQEENQDIDIPTIVDEALHKMAFMDGFEDIHFEKDLQFSDTIHTKKYRFNLIVENLISNAIKYRDLEKKSYVKISTRIQNNNFILEVKDNGLGIPEDQEKNMFTMFKRFHPKVAYGSGLGLYMMMKSANILNGNLTFKNNGEGSTFTFTIPKQERI